MAKDIKAGPAALPTFRVRLPPNETKLVADEMERQACTAEARGKPFLASKLRDRAQLLHQGKGEIRR